MEEEGYKRGACESDIIRGLLEDNEMRNGGNQRGVKIEGRRRP